MKIIILTTVFVLLISSDNFNIKILKEGLFVDARYAHCATEL